MSIGPRSPNKGHGPQFMGAKLSNANLSHSNLKGADFTGADLRGAVFVAPEVKQKSESIAIPRFEMETLSWSPRVFRARGFLSGSECEQMIALSKPLLEGSKVHDQETGEKVYSEARTSLSCFLNRPEHQTVPFLQEINHRVALFAQIPPAHGEAFNVLYYTEGKEFKPHYDYFDPARPGTDNALLQGGQRVLTVILYLSKVEEGGETEFPEIGLVVKPEKGMALGFYNVLPNMQLDPKSLHAGLPVVKGSKWVATKWWRERPRTQGGA